MAAPAMAAFSCGGPSPTNVRAGANLSGAPKHLVTFWWGPPRSITLKRKLQYFDLLRICCTTTCVQHNKRGDASDTSSTTSQDLLYNLL